MFYGLMTNKEFFESKVSVFVSLAPCCLMTSPKFASAFTANNLYQVIEGVTWLLDVDHLMPAGYYTGKLAHKTCRFLSPLNSVVPLSFCDNY